MIRQEGFTLIELLITLGLFAVFIIAIFKSYSVLLKTQVQQSEIAKASIEEGISLEILRKDIEMAGFALPWNMNGISYQEAVSDNSYIPDPNLFNDSSPSPPRAFVFSNNGNTESNNSDVLVIKSSVAALNDVTQRWGYITTDGVNITYHPLSHYTSTSGYFVVLNKNRDLEKMDYQPSSSTPPSFIDPLTSGDIYFAFGISSNDPRMPFNRVDYFLKKPSSGFPNRCAPNTYILYRATINQTDGKRNPQPVLDCVKDFQVAFGLDNNQDGNIDVWSSDLPGSASEIRNRVKQLRIFILYQEGKRDPSYVFDSPISLGDSDTGILSTFTPAGDEVHYRWKIMKLVVNPLNLAPLQR